MTFVRHNIFDFIGRHQSRYEHAVVTSFTFDFAFFDERIMRAFRAANIRNINVLLDTHSLEHLLENSDDAIFNGPRPYSLIPVNAPGVFHPKILLLTGRNEGCLAIGSGNFTASGMGTNDEVWGVFHMNGAESVHKPLFSAAWKYLQPYLAQAKGFHVQKLGWITQNTPWLNELISTSSEGWFPLNQREDIAFIGNRAGASTLAQLATLLPAARIKQLTIVSPYFDENGTGLTRLREAFNIDVIRCITDTSCGLLPYRMASEQLAGITFLNWRDCIDGEDREINRLHAKMFHFEFQDGYEYLLLGSANATDRGLGSLHKESPNAEAGVVLRRRLGRSTYLSGLGIRADVSKAIDVRTFSPRTKGDGDALERLSYTNRIVLAERNGNHLMLRLKDTAEASDQIGIVDGIMSAPNLYSVPGSSSELNVLIKEQPEQSVVVALYRQGKRITPFVLADDVACLAKTNPDARQAALNTLIDEIMVDPEAASYAELLEYFWLEDEEEYLGSNYKTLALRTPSSKKEDDKFYESIDEATFNQLDSVQLREAALLNNGSSHIADLLHLLSNGLVVSKNLQESIEQQLMVQAGTSDEGTGGTMTDFPRNHAHGAKDAHAINKYLLQVIKRFEEESEELVTSGSLKSSPDTPLTLKDLNTMAAALSLLVLFAGKKYAEKSLIVGLTKDNQHKAVVKKIITEFLLKPFNGDQDSKYRYFELESVMLESFRQKMEKEQWVPLVKIKENKINNHWTDYLEQPKRDGSLFQGLKWYITKVLGTFLFCANRGAGYKTYEYPSAKARLVSLRHTIFQKGLFLLLNESWSEKEVVYRDLMLLDLLHNVYPNPIQKEDVTNIQKAVWNYYEHSHKKHPGFSKHWMWFAEVFLPGYIHWREIFDSDDKSPIQKPISEVTRGSWVYQKNFGFASVIRTGKKLGLQKANTYRDELTGLPIFDIEYPFSSILIFKNT